MKSKDSHLKVEKSSMQVADRAMELLSYKLDSLIADRITVNQKLLTVKGAMEYLCVGRSTFYALVKKHQPMKIYLGGSPRYSIIDLDKMFSFDKCG